MKNVNEKRYENISSAVAFVIAFEQMIYSYDNVGWAEYEREICSSCGLVEQYADFLAPKSNCKRDYGILQSYHYGVSTNIRDELIENFDITENDFRPIRNKVGDIVFSQITPTHIMKPISKVNRIKALKPCRRCGSVQHRIKEYKNKNNELYYYITQEALDDLHDINKTFEEFDMFFPLLVISRRVYEYLISKYPRMRFYPMFLTRKTVDGSGHTGDGSGGTQGTRHTYNTGDGSVC